jgi:hypothetical protein
VLLAEEMHELLDAIDTTSLLGIRACAATGRKVEDFYVLARSTLARVEIRISALVVQPPLFDG